LARDLINQSVFIKHSLLYEKCDHIVNLDYGRECGFSLSAASAAAILSFEAMRQNFFNH